MFISAAFLVRWSISWLIVYWEVSIFIYLFLLTWNSSPEHQQRVAELDRRIHDLNEESAEMYKTQSENAQRLVHMNEQLQKASETEKRDSAE